MSSAEAMVTSLVLQVQQLIADVDESLARPAADDTGDKNPGNVAGGLKA